MNSVFELGGFDTIVEFPCEHVPVKSFRNDVRCGFKFEGVFHSDGHARSVSFFGKPMIIESIDDVFNVICGLAESEREFVSDEMHGLLGTVRHVGIPTCRCGSVNVALETDPVKLEFVHRTLSLWVWVLRHCDVSLDPSLGAGCNVSVGIGKELPFPTRVNLEMLVDYFRPVLRIFCTRKRSHDGFVRWNGVDAFEFLYPDATACAGSLWDISALSIALVLKAIKLTNDFGGVVTFTEFTPNLEELQLFLSDEIEHVYDAHSGHWKQIVEACYGSK